MCSWHPSELRLRLFQRLLWSESAVLVDPTASKETVMHHALGKKKNGDGQPDKKQELCNLEPGRLFPRRDCLIRILSHLNYLPTKSSDCNVLAVQRESRTRNHCSIIILY